MYWKYLKYVFRHKWYVLVECFKMGLIWRGICHDLSKFLPGEFVPYARFFYGKYPSLENVHGDMRNRIQVYKEDVARSFDLAWLLHQKRNDHHWQWWILTEDDGGTKIMPMSINAIKELVCDWIGAGMAISGREDPWPWYQANREKMKFHSDTRRIIEMSLDAIHKKLIARNTTPAPEDH